MTTTLSVRITTDTKKQLETLARRARRSKSLLAAEAIAAFVEAESWQLDEIQAGMKESMKAVACITSTCRPGFVRGAGSVSGRHLARDRRLVAARDQSPC
jgi:predicted transcriptional regulator